MRSDAVVIVSIGFEYPAQMRLAQDNDVVHTHAGSIRSAVRQSHFARVMLVRWLVPDAHGAQSTRDDAAVDPVAIADEVVRSFIPRKRLRYLTRNPFGRRICRDVDPDQVSAIEPDDDEGIEQAETDRRDNEQVHSGNIRRVITQKGSPSLAWRPA